VREHGCLSSASHIGANDHACWAFQEIGDFHRAAVEFLSEGLGLGQRLVYFGEEPAEELCGALAPLGDVEGLIAGGSLALLTPDPSHDAAPIDAESRLARVSAATDRALADGYTGLRIAVEGTCLLAGGRAFDAHLRWESTIDRYMSAHPLAALCGYDSSALPALHAGELCAIHPACNEAGARSSFHVFFEDPTTVVVDGEVDVFMADAFDHVLRHPLSHQGLAALDLSKLGFVDHHGLRVLADRVAADPVTVRNMPASARRLCDLLEIEL
jgi:MEDS: MEthanogen/methylotroph, DcmR Sensory domain